MQNDSNNNNYNDNDDDDDNNALVGPALRGGQRSGAAMRGRGCLRTIANLTPRAGPPKPPAASVSV